MPMQHGSVRETAAGQQRRPGGGGPGGARARRLGLAAERAAGGPNLGTTAVGRRRWGDGKNRTRMIDMHGGRSGLDNGQRTDGLRNLDHSQL